MRPVADMREEKGSVLTIVAVALPVLLVIFVLVVETANWFEHRRHLQLQADAGVFAAGPLFNRCFGEDGWPAAHAEIRQTALRYSGDPGTADRFNAQLGLGEPGDVFVRVNEQTFERGGPGPDDTVTLTGDVETLCEAEMLDLKLTEADLPWFMQPAESVFAINAHARIEIQKLVELVGSLPVAIPDPNPRLVAVELVNESGGAAPCASPPCVYQLQDLGIDQPAQVRRWGNAAPIQLTIPSGGAKIGVRVNLGGELAFTCDAPNQRFVACYDRETPNGLALIRGYDTGGTATDTTAPIVRGVWPTTLTCTGGPSFFYTVNTCSVGAEAQVDFGTGGLDPTLPLADGGRLARVEARVGGSAWMPLTWAAGGIWSTAANAFSIAPGSGPHVVDLRWAVRAGTVGGNTCTTLPSNPCTGQLLGVQRVFSGTLDRSGSVRGIALGVTSGTYPSPYSLPAGTHELNVQVATTYFHPADPDNPEDDETVFLRLVGGSQSFAIDCDADVPNFRDEIIDGCHTPYQLNADVPGCPPDRVVPTPDDCVPQQTGASVGQLRQGMNTRFGCAPNNWDLYPDLPQNDIRAVPLIMTDFGAFEGSGSSPAQLVAIRRFATFYVTGWDGGESCGENEPYPFPGSANGNIWGHFIRQIAPPNFGRGDPEVTCDFLGDDLDICIAVLTR